MSLEERQKFVRAHNAVRATVLPAASRMLVLTDFSRMEALANSFVRRCVAKRSNSGDYRDLGQALFLSKVKKSADEIVLSWRSGIEQYNFATRSCKSADKMSNCRNFKAAMNERATQMACARHRCTEGELVVCLYLQKRAGGLPAYSVTDRRRCEACPSEASWCLYGLCEKTKSEKTQCQLVCQNCGTLDESKCECKCKAGTSGHLCSGGRIDSSTCPTTPKCPITEAQCRPGTLEAKEKVNCTCTCPEGRVGNRCQYTGDEIRSAIAIEISGPQYDIRDKTTTFPLYEGLISLIWSSAAQQQMIQSLKDVCKDSSMKALCCDKEINNPEIRMIDGFPKTGGNDSLIFFFNILTPKRLCPSDPKLSTEERYFVSSSFLLSWVKQKDDLRRALSTSYSVRVTGVTEGWYFITGQVVTTTPQTTTATTTTTTTRTTSTVVTTTTQTPSTSSRIIRLIDSTTTASRDTTRPVTTTTEPTPVTEKPIKFELWMVLLPVCLISVAFIATGVYLLRNVVYRLTNSKSKVPITTRNDYKPEKA